MDLRFSPEENAFRRSCAASSAPKVPAIDPQQGDARAATSTRRRWSPRTRSCTPRASPCRTGPRSGAAPTGRPCSTTSTPRSCSSTACRSRCPSTSRMCGPVVIAFGTPGAEEALPAAHGGARRLVVPGLLRARRRLRPRRPQDHGRAPGRPLRRQRPEDLDHAGAVRRLDLLPVPHRSRPPRSSSASPSC